MKFIILILFNVIFFATVFSQQVPTTLDDFFLPGSQPDESGNFNSMPGNCQCHEGYEPEPVVEPFYNWEGSMMAQAMRDPLYLATLTIANQDAAFSGDLCIRCHSPRGWLSGRSTPTDGSDLTDKDREGIYCDFCHRAVKPTPISVNPYPLNTDYTTDTYPADQEYLQTISAHIPETSANGMFVIDSDDARRGPYTEEDSDARHAERYSPFHQDAYFCGTCHDVSNPVYQRVGQTDEYIVNDFGTPSPSFDPYTMFPVERTFSEWKKSTYNTAQGVYAPQFGGNKDYVATCQDCHMRDVTGAGCDKNGAPIRTDLALHDMTGGNTFVPALVSTLFPSEVNPAALTSGVDRATSMLQKASTLDFEDPLANGMTLRVKVTNETGHKLPSGYPEGRRIWLNIIAFSDDAKTDTIYQSGAYNRTTGHLTHDTDIKIYEIKPGSETEPSFHFVLNNTIHKDNRIPPRGFTNENYEEIQSPPVNYTYADGQHWDFTEYPLPPETKYFEIKLYYQTTSREYIEFLRDENVTDNWGQTMYDLWVANGKSAPVLMDSTGNDVPLPVELTFFNANVINKYVEIVWQTSTEINNYGFEIERKTKKSDWEVIAFVEGHGNSYSLKDYSYTDKDKLNGVVEYRLKQIDTDGGYEYSSIVQVSLKGSNKYKLAQNHPNPFNPSTTISYSIPNGGHVKLVVFNPLGEEIKTLVDRYQNPGEYESILNARNLQSGVYLYQLQVNDFITVKKMLLLK